MKPKRTTRKKKKSLHISAPVPLTLEKPNSTTTNSLDSIPTPPHNRLDHENKSNNTSIPQTAITPIDTPIPPLNTPAPILPNNPDNPFRLELSTAPPPPIQLPDSDDSEQNEDSRPQETYALNDMVVRVVRGGSRITQARAKRFLQELCKCGNVTEAATKAGLARRTVYHARERDKQFKALWDEAIEIAVDAGEAELRRRAIEGVERLKYDRSGVLMQRERVYSDKLLEVYVRANKPNKYREKDANVNVQVGIAFTMNAPPARSISIQAKTCNNTATEQDQRPKTLDIDVDETDS